MQGLRVRIGPLVLLRERIKGLFDLSDVHLQELVGCEGKLLALIYVMNQLVTGQRNHFVHVES